MKDGLDEVLKMAAGVLSGSSAIAVSDYSEHLDAGLMRERPQQDAASNRTRSPRT